MKVTHFFFSPMRRALTGLVLAVAGLVSATPAIADAVYRYTGRPFAFFSCGPSSSGTGTALCATPAPGNPFTSYLASDFVSATLTLTTALPANLALTDVRTFAGFALTMNDGRHEVTHLIQNGMFAEVATDAAGNINRWRLVINTGFPDNGGIATQNATFVADSGTLRCCDPRVSGDTAFISNMPGSWSAGPPSPAAALANLMTLVTSPGLMLTVGQINSLTDKLSNALASVQAGQTKQAINQLNAFLNSVEASRKTGRISGEAASMLNAAASAIIALLA